MTSSWLLLRVVELTGAYLVQSTLYLVAALALSTTARFASRFGGKKLARFHDIAQSPAFTERVWKFAAVLGLVTAPLSLFSGWAHPAWEWSFRERSTSNVLAAIQEPFGTFSVDRPDAAMRAETVTPNINTTQPAISTASDHLEKLRSTLEAAASEPLASHVASTSPPNRYRARVIRVAPIPMESVDDVSPAFKSSVRSLPNVEELFEPIDESPERADSESIQSAVAWIGIAIIVWIAISAARLVMKAVLLSRRLRDCRPVGGALRNELNGMPCGRSIRLLSPPSDGRGKSAMALREPFVCGLFRWTIVVPEGIDQKLSTAERKALLAHEVAHLIRRDLQWKLLFEVLGTSLVFQPLNLLARRHWQKAAECMCDDWAVENQVSAVSLASCLTKIAEWRLDRANIPLQLAVMGQPGALTKRIEWLLREDRIERNGSRTRVFATFLAFVAGALVGIHAPRLSLDTPVEAATTVPDDEMEVTRLRTEIRRELSSALNELQRMDSQLPGDSEAAEVVQRLRKRAAELRRD